MKVYSVDKNKDCIELVFKSEDDADSAFNEILASKNGVGEITDMTGRKCQVYVSYGYSTAKSDIMGVLEKEVK